MTVFFTSDHHFGDARRLGIDRRPFASAAEMDAAMVERWNAAVGPADEVWHLGDVAKTADPAGIAALLGQLHGTKHLLVGNNDAPATLEAVGWASVQHYAEIVVDGTALVLGHYPFRTWNGKGRTMGRGAINLHGHSHGRLGRLTRQYDVGVDVRDFAPVTLAGLRAGGRRVERRTGPSHLRLQLGAGNPLPDGERAG